MYIFDYFSISIKFYILISYVWCLVSKFSTIDSAPLCTGSSLYLRLLFNSKDFLHSHMYEIWCLNSLLATLPLFAGSMKCIERQHNRTRIPLGSWLSNKIDCFLKDLCWSYRIMDAHCFFSLTIEHDLSLFFLLKPEALSSGPGSYFYCEKSQKSDLWQMEHT